MSHRPPVPDLLEDYLSEADDARARQANDLYPLRLLDITRKIRAIVPEAKAVLLDMQTRWQRPIGPVVTAVRGSATWSATNPPEWLRNHDTWLDTLACSENHLAYALGLDEPDTLGWHHEGDGEWRVDLLAPIAVDALNTFQRALFTGANIGPRGPWAHLELFSDNSDTDAQYFARRECRNCRGQGLVTASTATPNTTDTCSCVRRLPI